MGCNITASIDLLCADQRQAAGVRQKVWLGNIDQLADDPFTIDSDGYVTDINFVTYGGLYSFVGPKKSPIFTTPATINEGSNKMFTPGGTIKLFSSSPADDKVIQELLVANVFAVIQDYNQNFFIYGGYNGLEISDLQKTTEADTAFVITLQGEEKNLPLRVLLTDYATTKALIESYEV
jgi:hypothetical protein